MRSFGEIFLEESFLLKCALLEHVDDEKMSYGARTITVHPYHVLIWVEGQLIT